MVKQREGFPAPVVDFDDEGAVREFLDKIDSVGGLHSYLLLYPGIGELRSADPILGDLTVVFRDAYLDVKARFRELLAITGVGL